ncbi:MAG TPA: nucleotidyltransferase domain-containing protein [Candidatus Acetothermia bacterium]|nr:nucleotidyltransferase domain-containing protein [Candidatus Acetothermia bacterium]
MIDIKPAHLKTVEHILAEHVPACEVRAFGSRVAGRSKVYSDLDLAVVCQKNLSAECLRHLKEAFEESDLPFRVDVLDWNRTSESFRKVIEQGYEVIQESLGSRPLSGKLEAKV